MAGDERGLSPGLLRGALSLASVPYGAVVRLRAAAYRTGFLPSSHLPRPVLSVGNITTGGTGKTPMVEELARRLGGKRKVAILTRGYAAGPAGSDEVNLLRENLPAAEVCPGADREGMGRKALRQGEVDVFLLDDGFQHLRLDRDLDIVMIDALRPFGYGRLLPRGLLREPVSALRRAEVVAISRVNQVGRDEVEGIRREILRIHPKAAILEVEMAPSLIRDGREEEVPSTPAPLRGESILPFCGIGNPESFAMSLQALGSEAPLVVFPDHHLYGGDDMRYLEEEGKRRGAAVWVTTQKDAGKIRMLSPPVPLWVVRVRARPGRGGEDLDRHVEEAISRPGKPGAGGGRP